jgi:ribosomal-protein-alanine N-acetyltransferase
MILRSSADRQSVTVIQYQRRDRSAVRDLLIQPHHLHNQLDWHEAEAWLEQATARAWTIWQGQRLVGLVGMSEPVDGAAWLRLAIMRMEVDASGLLRRAWESMLPMLRAAGAREAAVLIGDSWWMPHFMALGFTPYDEIITLRRSSVDLPAIPSSALALRTFAAPDLQAITMIDRLAFSPPWQMGNADIRQAERMSASAIVAVQDGHVVGFQLSTFYFDGAHLARLAVHPDYQGRGVGQALVADLILRMSRRSVYIITVNTQLTNMQSQRLYHRFGFTRTGYDLPVWVVSL